MKKIIVGLFVIFIALVIIFWPRLFQANPPEQVPSPTVSTSTPDPQNPSVTSPQPNTQVTSPLVVTGTVPPGWMFEGSFPITVVDAARNPIVTTTAHEVTPGSWQSGNPVPFTATLTFTTTASSGFLILENDNPSGLPANAKSYEIPVTF